MEDLAGKVPEVPCACRVTKLTSSYSISTQGILPGGGSAEKGEQPLPRSIFFGPFDVSDPRYGQWVSDRMVGAGGAKGNTSNLVVCYCNLGSLIEGGLAPDSRRTRLSTSCAPSPRVSLRAPCGAACGTAACCSMA